MNDSTKDYPKVRIRYEGPKGSHTVVGLASRTKYGRHEYGDVFWVLREDAAANPEYFKVLGDQETGSVADSLPKTADGVRMPTSGGVTSQPNPMTRVEGLWQPSSGEASPTVTDLWVKQPDAAPAESGVPPRTPANLVTLDQLGVNERIAATLAGVGLIAVSDVVEYGVDKLDEISGIGAASKKEIIGALKEHGYLDG